MIIAPEYIAKISQSQSELSDEEFLVQSIWYAKSFFVNELVFVKNIRCEFIAFSEKASLEFDLSHDILGKTFYAAANIHKLVQDEIYQHELQLLNDRKMQNSFYFYNKNEEIHNYSVCKRALVNPATNAVVGILINSERVMPNVHRKIITQEFFGSIKPASDSLGLSLSVLQKQILFCLLIGINNRKEIATTLSKMTDKHVSENQIKNSLQALYHTFKCSSTSQLVNLLLIEQIPFEIPANTLPLGNYLI